MKLPKLTRSELFWWTLAIAIALALFWYRSEIVQHFAEMDAEERNALLRDLFFNPEGLQFIGCMLLLAIGLAVWLAAWSTWLAVASIASAIDCVRRSYAWMKNGATTLLGISDCSQLPLPATVAAMPDKPCDWDCDQFEPFSFVIYPTDASGTPGSNGVTYQQFGVNLFPSPSDKLSGDASDLREVN